MRLSEREQECFNISMAGFFALRRLSLGVLLNYAESEAILNSQVKSKQYHL